MKAIRKMKVVLLAFLFGVTATAAPIFVDFENIADSTQLGTQYASSGLTFSGGFVVVSGAFGGSLNEIEFPPRSGAGVFLNESTSTSLVFASPITSFQAFFTYGGSLSLTFYDGSNTLLSLAPAFGTNLALSGDAGSSPNEELIALVLNNATRLEIVSGSDFTMDDLTFSAAESSNPIPEPSTAALMTVGAIIGFAANRLFRIRGCSKTSSH